MLHHSSFGDKSVFDPTARGVLPVCGIRLRAAELVAATTLANINSFKRCTFAPLKSLRAAKSNWWSNRTITVFFRPRLDTPQLLPVGNVRGGVYSNVVG